MNYKYAQLDPRDKPEARAHNEAIFVPRCPKCGNTPNPDYPDSCVTDGTPYQVPTVWGLEVTNKEWASRCEVNIDPQHGNSHGYEGADVDLAWGLFDSTKAACEVALTIPLPPNGTTLLFDRVDLDAVCAGAILELRQAGEIGPEAPECDCPDSPHSIFCARSNEPEHAEHRLRAVADADNFGVGKTPWQPYPLPTRENPWPASGSVDSRRELAAINRAVMDRDVPLKWRVWMARDWLVTGDEPVHPYRELGLCEMCGAPEPSNPLEGAVKSLFCGRCIESARADAIADGYSTARPTYREEVEAERQEIIAALDLAQASRDAGTTLCGDVIDIYVVSLSHVGIGVVQMPGKPYPGATGLGFAVAPITVCVTDHFQGAPCGSTDGVVPCQCGNVSGVVPCPGTGYRKVTIASWGALSPEQMGAIRDRLNSSEPIWGPNEECAHCQAVRLTLGEWQEWAIPVYGQPVQKEPGWGGNLQSGILGSPQGRSTDLSVEQILDAIRGVM